MSREKTSALILFILILGVMSPLALAIGVQPMVLDFEGRPGEQYSFEISIFPESIQRVVNLSLYQPIQFFDGSVDFLEGDPKAYPPIGWVRLEKERILVPPGEPTKVQGTISVPFSAGGSHSVIVMVEPTVEDAEEGVTVIVRYAVRLTINVDRPGLRSELKILNTELVSDEDGKPLLMVHISNPSPFRFPISGESTIRDENRRLVERVNLRTLSAWETGHDSFAIYPYTELMLTAPIEEPLYGGNYYLQNFISYDTTKQVIKTQEVFVEEGQFVTLGAQAIAVEPKAMEAHIQLGAATTFILQMENRQAEQFEISLGAEDIVAEYAHSIFEHLEIELRGEEFQTLQPRGRGRSILLVRAPRDAEPGGYYGKINVHVSSGDGEYVESYTIPMSVLVGRDLERAVEVRGIAVETLEEEYLFSASIGNAGNVHVTPWGKLELRDENDDVVNIVRLEMPEGVGSLLPDLAGFLVATIHEDYISPGSYMATVQVFEDQERVGIAEFPLVIEK